MGCFLPGKWEVLQNCPKVPADKETQDRPFVEDAQQARIILCGWENVITYQENASHQITGFMFLIKSNQKDIMFPE